MKYALCVAFTPPNCLTRFSARCRASPATSSSGGGARCLGGLKSVWATPPCLLTLSSLRCNAWPASSGGEWERGGSRSVWRTPPCALTRLSVAWSLAVSSASSSGVGISLPSAGIWGGPSPPTRSEYGASPKAGPARPGFKENAWGPCAPSCPGPALPDDGSFMPLSSLAILIRSSLSAARSLAVQMCSSLLAFRETFSLSRSSVRGMGRASRWRSFVPSPLTSSEPIMPSGTRTCATPSTGPGTRTEGAGPPEEPERPGGGACLRIASA